MCKFFTLPSIDTFIEYAKCRAGPVSLCLAGLHISLAFAFARTLSAPQSQMKTSVDGKDLQSHTFIHNPAAATEKNWDREWEKDLVDQAKAAARNLIPPPSNHSGR